MHHTDVVVVGAGIVGLAHAWAAARRGLEVVVVERHDRCIGASVRNFGFVTITGQAADDTLDRARRSAARWRDLAAATGLPVLHERLLLALHTPEGRAVAEAYVGSDDAPRCVLWSAAEARERVPTLRGAAEGVLVGLEDLRVPAAAALPALARHLEECHGVVFRWRCPVLDVDGGVVHTVDGDLSAAHVFVCPGDALDGPFAPALLARDTVRCTLQMLRLEAPADPLPGVVMSELGMVRYPGYTALPRAAALRARLEREAPDLLADGIHLIVAQDPDGTLIVGDSHRYETSPSPFHDAATEARILRAFADVLGPPGRVLQRWTGTYAYAPGDPVIVTPLGDRATLTVVARGKGMSVGFALGEEGVAAAFGPTDRNPMADSPQ